jgi:hypothetical protein
MGRPQRLGQFRIAGDAPAFQCKFDVPIGDHAFNAIPWKFEAVAGLKLSCSPPISPQAVRVLP